MRLVVFRLILLLVLYIHDTNELFIQMVRHGGCLGLGLAAMGTARQDVYEQLKFNLYEDDAVTGMCLIP